MAKLLSLTQDEFDVATNRQASTSSFRSWTVEFETMLSHHEDSRFTVFYNELSETGATVRSEIKETQRKDYAYSTE